jgi:hypothetical protein
MATTIGQCDSTFVKGIMREYYNVLELVDIKTDEADAIINLIYNKNKIEIDGNNTIINNKFVYSIVDILQSIFKLANNIYLDNFSNSYQFMLDFEINELRNKMILAVELINEKHKQKLISLKQSEGGKCSIICIGILKAIVDLMEDNMNKNKANGAKDLWKYFMSKKEREPLRTGEYIIYSKNGKIFEQQGDSIRSISRRSFDRYVKEYSIDQAYLSKLSENFQDFFPE